MHTPNEYTSGLSAGSLDGAIWRKSSYSGTQGNCVEVAANLTAIVAVRDSKNPDGAALIVARLGQRSLPASGTGGRWYSSRRRSQKMHVNAWGADTKRELVSHAVAE